MRPSRVTLAKSGGWFDPPPQRKKFLFCQAKCRVPGFPEDIPTTNPYWMDGARTGSQRYLQFGPSMSNLSHTQKAWQSDEAAGIPKMPPTDNFGNDLIPRDEAAKFMPDIYIEGLAEEIEGDLRTAAKHIVPHQFHEFYDESLVAEKAFGPNLSHDKSREHSWRANTALYVQRHHLADEMQRKMRIGDAEAQDRYQDDDDVEYEGEMLAAIAAGDIDRACMVYKGMMDPPKNWEIYVGLTKLFADRGLLADAIAMYDDMQIHGIEPNGVLLGHLVDCAIAAEHAPRVAWVVGESRRALSAPIPRDQRAAIATKAVKFLIDAAPALAARVYKYMKDEDLLAVPDMEQEAAQLLAQARDLGILPPQYATGVHAHRHATTLPTQAVDGEGAQNASPKAGSLAPADIARLDALLKEDDPVLPYFRKSMPNHVLQPGVVRAFRYESASGGARTYPSSRRRDVVGGAANPLVRYTFRWNGEGTRMVSDGEQNVSHEMWLR